MQTVFTPALNPMCPRWAGLSSVVMPSGLDLRSLRQRTSIRAIWRCLALLGSACAIPLPAVAQQASTQPQEVVVQASPLDRHSTRDPAASSTVLRRSDLDQPGASAATVLMKTPGAQLQRSGAASETANVSLRGTTSAQLPVYLGPVLLNDELTGAADLSTVPLFFIERMEIYRGHAPGFVDRLGLGGAIVLEPRRPKGTRAVVASSVGSFGARSTALALSSGNATAGAALGIERASAKNDYSYWHNGGTPLDPSDDHRVTRQNADFTQTQFWNTGHYRPSAHASLQWVLHALEREQGATSLSVIPSVYSRTQLRRELGAITARMPCAKTIADTCHIELQTQLMRSAQVLKDPTGQLGYGVHQLDTLAERAAQRVQVSYLWSPRLLTDWIVAAELSSIRRDLSAGVGLLAARRSGLVGMNANYSPSANVTIMALGRLWNEHSDGQDAQSTQTRQLPSGRFGAAYQLTDGLVLRANLGAYVRSPTLAELYGASASIRGNPDLQQESGTSEDLGFTWQYASPWLRLFTEASAYHQRTQNLVAWQRTTFAQVRPYNVGQSRQLGVDLSGGLGVREIIRFEGVLGLVDPRDTTPSRVDTNATLPYRSRLTSYVRLELALPKAAKAGWARVAAAGVSYARRSSRYVSKAGNSVIPHSDSVDLDARIGLESFPLLLRGNILNVLNRQNFDLIGLPLPGRAFYLGAEIALEFDS